MFGHQDFNNIARDGSIIKFSVYCVRIVLYCLSPFPCVCVYIRILNGQYHGLPEYVTVIFEHSIDYL